MFKIETTTRETNSMPFLVFGSFADQIRDRLRFGILGNISGLGIICGRGSFAALYSFLCDRYALCLLHAEGAFNSYSILIVESVKFCDE